MLQNPLYISSVKGFNYQPIYRICDPMYSISFKCYFDRKNFGGRLELNSFHQSLKLSFHQTGIQRVTEYISSKARPCWLTPFNIFTRQQDEAATSRYKTT